MVILFFTAVGCCRNWSFSPKNRCLWFSGKLGTWFSWGRFKGGCLAKPWCNRLAYGAVLTAGRFGWRAGECWRLVVGIRFFYCGFYHIESRFLTWVLQIPVYPAVPILFNYISAANLVGFLRVCWSFLFFPPSLSPVAYVRATQTPPEITKNSIFTDTFSVRVEKLRLFTI